MFAWLPRAMAVISFGHRRSDPGTIPNRRLISDVVQPDVCARWGLTEQNAHSSVARSHLVKKPCHEGGPVQAGMSLEVFSVRIGSIGSWT